MPDTGWKDSAMEPYYLEQQGHPRCDPLNERPEMICSDCLADACFHALDTIRAIDIVTSNFLVGIPVGDSILSHTRPWRANAPAER